MASAIMCYSQPNVNGHVILEGFGAGPSVIDVRPNKEYFREMAKLGSNNDTLFKYNLWAPTRFGILPGYTVKQVKSDGNGGCVVTGEVVGTLAHNGDSLKPQAAGNTSLIDIFIIHFNADGSRKWWARISDSWSQYPTQFYAEKTIDVAVKNNKIYWLVEFGHNAPTYHLGNSNGYNQSFTNNKRKFVVLSFNNDGSINWSFEPSEAVLSNPKRISVNNAGEVAVLVTSQDKLILNSSVSLLTAGRLAVVKLNATGSPEWVTAISNDNNIESTYKTCQIDNSGNVYTCLTAPGAGNNGNTVLGINPGHDYVVKLSSTGSIDWHRKYNGTLYGAYVINNKLVAAGGCNSTDKYLQTGAADSVIIKRDEANASAEFFAEFDANGDKTWQLIGMKSGIVKNTSLTGFNSSGMFDDGSGAYFTASFMSASVFGSYTFPESNLQLIGYLTLNTSSTPTLVKNSSKEANQFNVYPNPSNGNFTISTNKPGKFALTDINGKTISEYFVNSEPTTINANLPKGVYILVNNESGAVKKIIID